MKSNATGRAGGTNDRQTAVMDANGEANRLPGKARRRYLIGNETVGRGQDAFVADCVKLAADCQHSKDMLAFTKYDWFVA